MLRNPQIEVIHEARYHLQTCAEKDKPVAHRRLHDLLDQATAKAKPPVRPEDVLDALFDDYKEFCRMKRREGWAKLR